MSQLNNFNNEENNIEINQSTNNVKYKMKPITKVIIFLIIFAIIAVGITVAAIFYTNRNTDSKTPVTPDTSVDIAKPVEITSDGLGVKSLTEQYNENDLKITEITDEKGTRTPTSQWDKNTSKVILTYLEIDGLKDTAIEAQINSDIKNAVYNLFSDDELNNSAIDSINISAYCNANFGNTLSISISKYIAYSDKGKERDYQTHHLNYDLATGNKLTLRDLFTNSSIRNALVQSVYDNLLQDYAYDSISEESEFLIDMSKVDLSTLEDETYVIVNKIMNNLDTTEFGFTPAYISLEIDGTSLYIEMDKIYNHIAIYNRFKTQDSIFDGSYEGQKNIFVFTQRYLGDFVQFTQYEDVYDNLRVEAHIDFSGYGVDADELLANSEVQKTINDCISKVKEEISDIKQKARENPDKAYIYCADYRVGTSTNRELEFFNIEHLMVYANGYSNTYEMSKNYYDQTFYAKIGEFYREEVPEVRYVFEGYYYIEDDSTDVKVTEKNINSDDEEYDIYTGKTKDELLDEYYESLQPIELGPAENTIIPDISPSNNVIDSNTIN